MAVCLSFILIGTACKKSLPMKWSSSPWSQVDHGQDIQGHQKRRFMLCQQPTSYSSQSNASGKPSNRPRSRQPFPTIAPSQLFRGGYFWRFTQPLNVWDAKECEQTPNEEPSCRLLGLWGNSSCNMRRIASGNQNWQTRRMFRTNAADSAHEQSSSFHHAPMIY